MDVADRTLATTMARPGRAEVSNYLLLLAWVQGIYYFLTGIWPLLSIQTFQMVTGPKTDNLPTGREGDHWLVMTVGVLVMAMGIVFLVSAWRWRVSPEVIVLAITSALGLTAVDVIYVFRRVISPVYLADAVLEIALVALWVKGLVRQQTRPVPPPTP